MSIEIMSMVFKSQIPSTQKFVLLAIADHCNHEGKGWPSIKKIATYTSLQERSVYRAIKDLEDWKILSKQYNPNAKSTLYIINKDLLCKPLTISQMTISQMTNGQMTHSHPDGKSPLTPDTQSGVPLTESHPNHNNNHHSLEPSYIPPIIPQKNVTPDFEEPIGDVVLVDDFLPPPHQLVAHAVPCHPMPYHERGEKMLVPKSRLYDRDVCFMRFWDTYPRQRRGSPHRAFQRWKKAIEDKEATAEEIQEGVERYAVSEEVAKGYAKGCQAWLNDYGWQKQYSTKGNPHAKYNPIQSMLNLRETGGELKEGIDYFVSSSGERILL